MLSPPERTFELKNLRVDGTVMQTIDIEREQPLTIPNWPSDLA